MSAQTLSFPSNQPLTFVTPMDNKFRFTVSYRNKQQAQEFKKNFVLSLGEENRLEMLMRHAFGISDSEGVLLYLNNETICYPLSSIDLKDVMTATTCELQTIALNNNYTNAPNPNTVSTIPSMKINILSEKPSVPGEVTPHFIPDGNVDSDDNKSHSNDNNNFNNLLNHELSSSNKKNNENNNENDNDNDNDWNSSSKDDKRKFNRGLDHRKSYLKEEKIFVMWLKDEGKSADQISQLTGVSKSNVEKWCSDKVREKVLGTYLKVGKSQILTQGISKDMSSLHFDVKNTIVFFDSLRFLTERLHAADASLFTCAMNLCQQYQIIVPTLTELIVEKTKSKEKMMNQSNDLLENASKRFRGSNEMEFNRPVDGSISYGGISNRHSTTEQFAANALFQLGTNMISPWSQSANPFSSSIPIPDRNPLASVSVPSITNQAPQMTSSSSTQANVPESSVELPKPRPRVEIVREYENLDEEEEEEGEDDEEKIMQQLMQEIKAKQKRNLLFQNNWPQLVDQASDFTMEYNDCGAWTQEASNQWTVNTSRKALRPILGNTKYLIHKREKASGTKILHLEFAEDKAIMHLLGE